MTTVKNINLHLTEENQHLLDELRKYVRENPELVNRIAKRNSGALSTNRIVNAVLAEFSQLFLKSDLNFIDREKQLLTVDGQFEKKSSRQLRQIERDTQRLIYLSLIINGAANMTKLPEVPVESRLDKNNAFGQWIQEIDRRIDSDWQRVRH
ncbi:hypothetical protein AZI11_14005 (plasmid) [Levilactobacillus brevis]|uniref:hypothetical protein n=1 Tax=Levilactobacillus brevis TaxID=1580 RepID=UPI000A20A433|nr:hypothetical protein [Levilactobacillus brevis]ARN93822.1 hypothetical protein AZI11_12825 [Levilactobacillus brevis]ARN94029.1 hypothetical protein AZI11_14005 [Levilactobacillus brevis]ARN96459.1 hypothetical protein AZI12_13250 [Levilactobacillus brevis]ARN96642.1 hypothetical protein AZI12_14315 [Levilactobacillus brevis]